jgi:uncharacterized membrane protein YtjA (UPF0391 family)
MQQMGDCPTRAGAGSRLLGVAAMNTLVRLEVCSIIALSGELIMLHYAVVFFVIALIAAVFGFGGIAAGAAGIAKILFFVFLIGAVITFLFSITRRA